METLLQCLAGFGAGFGAGCICLILWKIYNGETKMYATNAGKLKTPETYSTSSWKLKTPTPYSTGIGAKCVSSCGGGLPNDAVAISTGGGLPHNAVAIAGKGE